MRLLVFFLVGASFCPAVDPKFIEGWHGAEAELYSTNKALIRARAEVRISDWWRDPVQVRIGTEGRYYLHPHFGVIGMFQVIEAQARGVNAPWDEVNRVLGGIEVPWRTGQWDWTNRAAAERFIGSDLGNSNRYRNLIRARYKRGIQPALGVELFWNENRFLGWRPGLTFMVPIAPILTLDTGYYYDNREGAGFANRHIVYTYFRFHRARAERMRHREAETH